MIALLGFWFWLHEERRRKFVGEFESKDQQRVNCCVYCVFETGTNGTMTTLATKNCPEFEGDSEKFKEWMSVLNAWLVTASKFGDQQGAYVLMALKGDALMLANAGLAEAGTSAYESGEFTHKHPNFGKGCKKTILGFSSAGAKFCSILVFCVSSKWTCPMLLQQTKNTRKAKDKNSRESTDLPKNTLF